jgi:hypothetical protein
MLRAVMSYKGENLDHTVPRGPQVILEEKDEGKCNCARRESSSEDLVVFIVSTKTIAYMIPTWQGYLPCLADHR